MIELESLGAAWAMQNCRQFLEGLPTFELVTDHKPLVPILNSYALDKLNNPRLLRLRLKMQRYSFVARWVPGKQNMDADALPRAPVDQATAGDELGEGLPSFSAKIALLSLTGLDVPTEDASIDPVLEKIKRAAAVDPVMRKLRSQIVTGFPNDKCNLDLYLRPYWNVKERLAINESDDMIVVGPRVVIPQSVRADILRDLVQMHQGATITRRRARMSVYWSNIDNDIINATKNCCIFRPSQRNHSSYGQRPPARLNRSMPISAKSTAVIFLSSSTVSVAGLVWSHSVTKAQRPDKWSNISESFFRTWVRH